MAFFTRIEDIIADSKDVAANYSRLKSRLMSIECIESDLIDLIKQYDIERNVEALKDWIRRKKEVVERANDDIGTFKSLAKCYCIFKLVERAELNNNILKILKGIKKLEKDGKELKLVIYDEACIRQQTAILQEISQYQSEFFKRIEREQSEFFEESKRGQQQNMKAIRDEFQEIATQQIEFFRAIGGRRAITDETGSILQLEGTNNSRPILQLIGTVIGNLIRLLVLIYIVMGLIRKFGYYY